MKTIKSKVFNTLKPYQQDTFTGVIKYPFCTLYLLNGKKHRIDGPAIIWSDNRKSYYLFGKKITKKQHEFYCDLMKLRNIHE